MKRVGRPAQADGVEIGTRIIHAVDAVMHRDGTPLHVEAEVAGDVAVHADDGMDVRVKAGADSVERRAREAEPTASVRLDVAQRHGSEHRCTPLERGARWRNGVELTGGDDRRAGRDAEIVIRPRRYFVAAGAAAVGGAAVDPEEEPIAGPVVALGVRDTRCTYQHDGA
jgi:hypothetical protein